MKRGIKVFAIIFSFLFLTVINFSCSAHTTIEEGQALIRIHIRANSNEESDQEVKLKVRDAVTQYLSSALLSASSLQKAKRIISDERTTLEQICDEVLRKNGKAYESNARITNEFFPTRVYQNTVVQSGYYDALIIDLGNAQGDNWWCVLYPPMCFGTDSTIVYKSRIMEWWNKIFEK